MQAKQRLLSDYKKNQLQFRSARWDIVFKIAGPVLGVFIGIGQYFYQQEIQERKNFQREFWIRKFDMYGELSHSIGETLVALEYSDSLALIRARAFRTIYWKTLLVEDPMIEPPLVEFNDTLEDYFDVLGEIDGLARLAAATEPGRERNGKNEERLQNLKDAVIEEGINVMKVCRRSLENQKLLINE